MRIAARVLGSSMLVGAIAACSSDAPTPAPAPRSVLISKAVVVVEDRASGGVEVASDALSFEREGNGWLLDHQGELYLVSRTGEGFARKVTSKTSDERRILVATQQASLEELIEQGSIQWTASSDAPGPSTQHAPPLRLASPDTGFSEKIDGIDLSLKPEQLDLFGLEETYGLKIEPSLSLKLKPRLDVDLLIENSRIQRFDAVISGSYQSTADLKIVFAPKIAGVPQEPIDLWRGPTKILHFQAGYLPVIFTLQPRLQLVYEVQAGASLGFDLGIQAAGQVVMGGHYDASRTGTPWTAASASEVPSLTLLPPTFQVDSVGVQAEIYLRPRIDLKLYGVVGPFAYLKAGASGTFSLYPTPSVEGKGYVRGGLAGEIGNMKILGKQVPGISVEGLELELVSKALPPPNAESVSCTQGKGDCNGLPSDGCETLLLADPMHCGGCGLACPSDHTSSKCQSGKCVLIGCGSGYQDCNKNTADGCEVDLTTDPSHCGSCGHACPAAAHGSPSCAKAQCGLLCDPGYGDCDQDPSNGCEAALKPGQSCSSPMKPSLEVKAAKLEVGSPITFLCSGVKPGDTVAFFLSKEGASQFLATHQATVSGPSVSWSPKAEKAWAGPIIARCRNEALLDQPSDAIPLCIAETCSSLDYECGPAQDGCGKALSCGGCGAQTPAPSCQDATTLRTYQAPACTAGLCGAAPFQDSSCEKGCSAGACKTCLDACGPKNTSQCSGISVQSCVDLDADGCLEWGPATACPAGKTCQNESQACSGVPGAPTLNTPEDSSSISAGNVLFQWLPVPGAARYHLMVCQDAALSQGCVDTDGGMVGLEPPPATSDASVKLGAGTFFWSARAIGPDETSGWGPYAKPRLLKVVCSPSCAGKACGDDGCGTPCGSCAGDQTCNAQGQCVSGSTCPATKDCSGRQCGLDPVCQLSCGSCPADQACDSSGQCQALLCSPGSFYCAGAERRLCAVDGKSYQTLEVCPFGCQGSDCKAQCTQDADCAPDQFCEGQSCKAALCPKNGLYCNNGFEVWQCNASGSGGTKLSSCSFGCSAGQCDPQCSQDGQCAPGQYCDGFACQTDICPQGQAFCSKADERSQCSANGSQASVLGACPYGCDAATGQCKPCPADCSNKCGGASDGCGGLCNGPCGANQLCQGQICVGDPCLPDPCNGHGTCTAGACACAPPFAGPHCDSCAPGHASDYPTCTPLCALGAEQTFASGGVGLSALSPAGTGFGVAYQQAQNTFLLLDASGASAGSPVAVSTSGSTIGVAWSPTYNRFGLVGNNAHFRCISATGVLEGNEIKLCGGGSVTCTGVAIGSDGLGAFGVTWADDRTGEMRIYFNRVDANSCQLLQSDTLVSPFFGRDPAVAFGSSQYGVVWTDGSNGLWLTRLNSSGGKLGDLALTAGQTGALKGALAWNSSSQQWGVVWNDMPVGQPAEQLYLQRTNESGAKEGSSTKITSSTGNSQRYQHIAVAGSSYGLFWLDGQKSKASFLRLDSQGQPSSPVLQVAGAAVGALAGAGKDFLTVYQQNRSRKVFCQ